MTTTFITKFLDTTQTIGGNGSLFVARTGGVHVASGNAIEDTTSSLNFYIEGSIVGNDYGMLLDNSPGSNTFHRVVVDPTGSVTGFENSAISIAGSNGEVINHGTITTGRIGNIGAIDFQGENNSVVNSGTITGSIAIANGEATSGGTLSITNSGLLHGDSRAIDVKDETLKLYNSGEITSDGQNTIYTNGTQEAEIYNYGTIATFGTIVMTLTEQDDLVVNKGSISGNILMGDGADTFDGRGGSFTDFVGGEEGDDTYIVSDSAVKIIEGDVPSHGVDLVKSTVSFAIGTGVENLTLLTNKNINAVGNNDDNHLIGNSGNNRMQGQAGEDLIEGKLGDDRLFGSFDNDTLTGGKGDDVLRGGNDDDSLNGSNGDDLLVGGSGDDTLGGSRGDDVLKGGAGKDTMTGGDNDDVFLFTRTAHSTNANADVITDFSSGEDVIDLSAFNGTFLFVGTSGFSGTGPEIRATSAGSTRTVQVDVDGIGGSDMTIIVNSATALTALDFVL